MGAALFGGLLIVALVAFVYVAAGVKIIQPYQRGVIEHLGKYKETADPGLRLILPFVERIRTVDMREQVIDVPPQEVITQDNVAVSVDAVVYFEPTDPQRLLYNISNFILAVTKLAQTNLRNVIGEMTLDQAFTSRERVNGALRQILDDATDKWGVRVVRVEIQRIDPPTDVMHAMHEQMKAERTRRAVVTEAEGTREAAVTRAEGEKASNILSAEGLRQREILTAEGEAQAVRTRAEAEQFRQEVVAQGEANAIESVFGAIVNSGTDDRVIAIKYLEALQGIANGTATKIFIPADMSATLGSIGGIAEMLRGDSGDTQSGDEPDQPAPGSRPRAPQPAVASPAPRPTPPTPAQRVITPPPPPGV
ncbi:MAG: regulator of protease activity HflC (stomatin/prohibitin superfamily) [Acidimicrobiales bacterium]|jgi:regulator of protease activity HflC (stomatin/prohibitin superfamily)